MRASHSIAMTFLRLSARLTSIFALGLFISAGFIHPALAESWGPGQTSYFLSAPPSYLSIRQENIDEYVTAQSHGYCNKVLSMERAALVRTRPEFKERFAEGVTLTEVDSRALAKYALGFRRCRALRNLARVLAVPKLKGGEKKFSAFSPKPRIGNFSGDNEQALKQLLIDRAATKGLDRPLDWAIDPMSLDDELLLHRAYTDLVQLAVCHTIPLAFEDIGKLHDQNFSPINPFQIYGVFYLALQMQFDVANMQRRLMQVNDLFPPFVIKQLEDHANSGKLHKHPQLGSLFAICTPY